MPPLNNKLPKSITLCLLFLLLLPCSAAATSLFPNPVMLVSLYPTAMVVGDFNEDGRQDLAVANASGVSIFLSLGSGDFEPAITVSVAPQARSIAIGDFNGDGHYDLVTANWNTGDVSVIMGRGDGSFGPETRFPADRGPSGVKVGDFNADGHADLAVTNDNTDDVAILLGIGDGRFELPRNFPVGRAPFSLTVQDFNLDGKLDIATANYTSGDVSVLLGQGNGTFGLEHRFAVDVLPNSVVSGDFNSDGKADLALACQGDSAKGGIRILLGTGDGTFGPAVTVSMGPDSSDIALGDFNADGKLDLVAATGPPASPGIMVLLGRGDASFADPILSGVIGSTHAVVVGDLDTDGVPDLAVCSQWAFDVIVLKGRGNGDFTGQIPLVKNLGGSRVIAEDFNSDGKVDLAVGLDRVLVLLGHGDGSFDPPVNYSFAGGLASMASADFTGDGKPDLVLRASLIVDSTVLVYILRGRGDGTFETTTALRLQGGGGGMAVADFNSDGNLDLALSGLTTGGVQIFWGNGDGAFRTGPHNPVAGGNQNLAADLNGDGRQDLVTVSISPSYTSGKTVALLGAGDGTFVQVDTHALPRQPISAITADMNADEKPDLIVSLLGGAPYVFLGRGDGSFEAPLISQDATARGSLATADFDGDGVVDLGMGMAGFNGEVGISRGSGDGKFLDFRMFNGGYLPDSLAVGDFNGDHRPDIAAGNGDGVSIMLNRGGKAPNEPPVAVAGLDVTIECSSPSGGEVFLEGSESTDPNSTPGTNDDIVQFTWIEDFGSPTARVLGQGEKLQVTLALGEHQITLQVTDHAGATASDEIVATIVDTRPPALAVALTPELLWPPNSRMVTITATVTATDACGGTTFTLDSITKNESARRLGILGEGDDVQGADYGTADLSFMLRANRNPRGTGRIYAVVYTAVDTSGNSTTAESNVIVPHDMRDKVKGLEPSP